MFSDMLQPEMGLRRGQNKMGARRGRGPGLAGRCSAVTAAWLALSSLGGHVASEDTLALLFCQRPGLLIVALRSPTHLRE